MNKDVYHWRMSAADHRASVLSLVHEIKQAHASQQPMPVSLITDLLPLQTNDFDLINARGVFEFSGDEFINSADGELWVEFYDPVLEEFSTSLPQEWKGHLAVTETSLSIIFFEPLEIEMPRLSSLGVNRSSFQNIVSIHVTDDASLTRMYDGLDQNKETWIQAELSTESEKDILDKFGFPNLTDETEEYSESRFNPLINKMVKENSSECSDPQDPNWYVYKRNDGICIVHLGRILQNAHTYHRIAGPGTKEQMDSIYHARCSSGFC